MDTVNESPVLVSQTGELRGNRWVLEDDELLIGRAPDCDMVVPDRKVSRHHARLRKTENGVIVEDLGSKNGTHVNGTPVDDPVLLQDGDVISVALAVKLMFVGTEATVPLSVSEAADLGLGRLRMDPDAHRVWVLEEELEPPLSPAQFRLLELLYRNANRVVSRAEIVEHVWPESEEEGVSEQAIDALVRRLRDRLSEVDPDHSYVVTVRGHGFRLDNPL
ncbi:MAG: FHA domain-containing protein [Anaerolineales bacterium]|nr:FHA domain-containing protein [Anaerolineales bacterium]